MYISLCYTPSQLSYILYIPRGVDVCVLTFVADIVCIAVCPRGHRELAVVCIYREPPEENSTAMKSFTHADLEICIALAGPARYRHWDNVVPINPFCQWATISTATRLFYSLSLSLYIYACHLYSNRSLPIMGFVSCGCFVVRLMWKRITRTT